MLYCRHGEDFKVWSWLCSMLTVRRIHRLEELSHLELYLRASHKPQKFGREFEAKLLSVNTSIFLSIYLSIHLSIYLCLYLSTYLPTYLPTYYI